MNSFFRFLSHIDTQNIYIPKKSTNYIGSMFPASEFRHKSLGEKFD